MLLKQGVYDFLFNCSTREDILFMKNLFEIKFGRILKLLFETLLNTK